MADVNFRQVNILGVKIDDVSLEQAAGQVIVWVKNGGRHYIVTPNPEFIVAARRDPEFKKVLNSADLAVPDGAGLKLASDLESTTPGIDLLERLCNLAAEKGFTTGFLGGRDGVAKQAAECLKKRYPGLKVVFAEDGPEVNMDGELIARGPVGHMTGPVPSVSQVRPPPTYVGVRSTPETSPPGHPSFTTTTTHRFASPTIPPTDLLFVAFGQVKQEKWIAKNLGNLPVKVAMGVGGAFDYLSGKVPRAPRWMRSFGLEWLFRLIIQPWRVKRQLALLKFVWLVIKVKL